MIIYGILFLIINSCVIPHNKNYPAGCLRVEGDNPNPDPVEIARVIVKDSWFTYDIAYTNEDGCWSVNESYSNYVWMWVHFMNTNVKVRDTRFWLSTRVVLDYVDRFDDPPYNNINILYGDGATDNTSNARMYWAAAHTLNTLNQFRNGALGDNIPLPRENLNWLNAARQDGGGAAPMLQWQAFNSWIAFFLAQDFPLYYGLSLPLLPDVVNKYGVNQSSESFNGVGFHELGHTSHYSLVGESYWIPYRNHIIMNLGYGSFGNFNAVGSDPGRIALGEAIGYYSGAHYGNANIGGEGVSFLDNFIPCGLLWDLEDNFVDFIQDPNDISSHVDDHISGFTPEMFFDGLTPNVNDIRSFRDRLRILHLAETPNNAVDYNDFVDVYDVFN